MHNKGRRTIIVAKSFGFCSGVERAVSIVENLARQSKGVFTVDSILHNEREMARLEALGVKILNPNDSGEIVILPAHGATDIEVENLKSRFKKIIDVTCPFVIRTVNIIKKLKSEGYKIVIVGEKGHRETKVLKETAGESLFAVISDLEELAQFEKEYFSKIALVSQSTVSRGLSIDVSQFFLKHAFEFRFFDTVCPETVKRQEEAEVLAKSVDCVVVVGGKHSANTNRLYEIAKRINENALFVEDVDELRKFDISRCLKIGIVSGTSTPEYIIKEIVEYLESLP
ncbi:4-hydroxy-3-methylbut-2-enyl diphosphate reductase [Caldisericum exile]|uniref:4-hydroxy-3-methylbut-2-enyl diphosphate reductase n=1 Tax=Caldisericum exile (strain DSM 21853 / NBRC 104410 / AZM16c01) TaxID=511051 RepID=A0A7U6GDW8_CALEA|nr:4-hydroxy-3-methylbut-2-enyl diphosphate reductase [Caldisericum exile]BAL80566.1 4-hydroxy-3-methylbut-2-enyl diphosphate reductase [Caldisericum exile AZM16c01]